MPVTPADVRGEVAFSADAVGLDDTEFDALIADLIDRETERVEDELDVEFGVTKTTEVTSRPASVAEHLLPLSERPVQSVQSVTIDTDRVAGDGVTKEDLIVHESHLELLPAADRARWPTDRRSITVEYEAGVPDGDVEDVIGGAIIGLVRHALQEIESDGINSESVDGHSVNYEIQSDVVARHLSRAKRFDEPDFYGGTQVI